MCAKNMANNMSVCPPSLTLSLPCSVATLYAKLAAFKSGQSQVFLAFSSGCHSRLIGTFVELFGRTRHHVLLTHPLGCTYPRFDAVGLLRADNHPLSVAVSTEATASAPIVGYPTAEEADKWLVEYTKVGGGCRAGYRVMLGLLLN